MAAIYCLFFIKYLIQKRSKKAIFTASACFAGTVGLLFANGNIRERIFNLFKLKDASGVTRTIGGFFFLKYSPWYGTGPGNSVNFFMSFSSLPEIEQKWFESTGEFFNNILLSIIILGYIGALGFLVYQFAVLKKHKILFFALMAIHFGWGKLFDAPIWFFLLLYIAICDPYDDDEPVWFVRQKAKKSPLKSAEKQS
jgi:hypothetical protein